MKGCKVILLLTLAATVLGNGAAFGQFIWTKDVRNPILSGGGSGAWNQQLRNACVLYNVDSARYEMWFGAEPSSSLFSFTPRSIGFAFSQDGIAWTMHPTAVLSPDAAAWDGYTVDLPMVIRQGGQYKMWYSATAGADITDASAVGYATSPDGINWTKYAGNPVMAPGTAAWEVGGPWGSTVMSISGTYRMWYMAYDASQTFSSIGYATSSDGITWRRDTVNNPIFRAGAPGQWDYPITGGSVALRIGSTFYLWYYGCTLATDPIMTGLAVSSDGITNWTRHAENPVLAPSPGAWDANYISPAAVLLLGDTLHMWYAGSKAPSASNVWSIGHATSPLTPVGIAEGEQELPRCFMLDQNYPNPFNPSTTIRFTLPVKSHVTLTVFNALGEKVEELVNEEIPAGHNEVQFNAGDLASGVYIYRLQAGDFVQAKKLMVLQ